MVPSEEHRHHVGRVFRAAVAAADPYVSVLGYLGHELIGTDSRRVLVVGCGKAAVPMALAAQDAFGERIDSGLVVTKYGHTHGAEKLRKIAVREAGHPTPDREGLEGCRGIAEILGQATQDDLVVAVISGGGSALWPYPARGITLEDKRGLTDLLVGCGARIDEINTVRKHVSAIKGGRAARLASPAKVLCLVISDVVGDDLSSIASGPFVADNSTFSDALGVLENHGLINKAPRSVVALLREGVGGLVDETPGGDDPVFGRVSHGLCATNALALEGARSEATRLGYRSYVVSSSLTGDVAEVADRFMKDLKTVGEEPVCLLSGGEPTVCLGDSPGKGGRNQELSLLMGIRLAGQKKAVTFASCATDGTDGPTDAAGGVVDTQFLAECATLGVDPGKALEKHDSYPLLERTGRLIRTGPTNTNVMDIHICLVTRVPGER